MGELMAGEVTQLPEGATALLAHVRLVPSVNAFVRDQGTGTSESPATLIAHVLGLGFWTVVVTMRYLVLIMHAREMCRLKRSTCLFFTKLVAFLSVQSS